MTSEEIDALLQARPAATAPRRQAAPTRSLADDIGAAVPRRTQAPPGPVDEERDAERSEARHLEQERRRLEQERRREANRQRIRERCHPNLARQVLAQEDAKAAILIGPTGCGKTQAADFLTRGRAMWVKGADLSQSEREYKLGQGEPAIVTEARRAPLLVIDDLRAGQDIGALWRIIDHRYDHGLPMIVTSGLRRPELQEHLGAAGVRRIIEQHLGSTVLTVDCHAAEGP